MSCHGCAVDGGAFAWEANALSDVEDNACEAIFVKVDLLMVWNLTNRAILLLVESLDRQMRKYAT